MNDEIRQWTEKDAVRLLIKEYSYKSKYNTLCDFIDFCIKHGIDFSCCGKMREERNKSISFGGTSTCMTIPFLISGDTNKITVNFCPWCGFEWRKGKERVFDDST